METLRDIKRRARRDLHARLAVPALFIAAPGDAGTPITVRVHTKFDAIGIQGTDHSLATRREAKPKIIFLRDELAAKAVSPKRGAIVSVEPGEAYKLDNADAPDDLTISFFVTVLAPAEATGLPVPEVG